jgi:hypothetical protein
VNRAIKEKRERETNINRRQLFVLRLLFGIFHSSISRHNVTSDLIILLPFANLVGAENDI